MTDWRGEIIVHRLDDDDAVDCDPLMNDAQSRTFVIERLRPVRSVTVTPVRELGQRGLLPKPWPFAEMRPGDTVLIRGPSDSIWSAVRSHKARNPQQAWRTETVEHDMVRVWRDE